MDKENTNKLSKAHFKVYLQNLSDKIGTVDFQLAYKASSEAFDDVWYDSGCEEKGSISWHSVKPLIAKLIEHDAAIQKEQAEEAAERQVRLDDFNRRKADKERKRQEKLAQEAKENAEDN